MSASGHTGAALGWGIVGTATIADRELAPAIAGHEGGTLAAVVSRSADRAAAFCERHGGTPYTSLGDLLADDSVEAVYVASPNALHRDQAIAAMEAGKDVLVEKPMALTAAEGRDMVAAARVTDRVLGLAFHLRHKPSNRAARDAIARGDIGDVRLIQAHLGAGRTIFPYDGWRRDPSLGGGAGTLVHQGTHLLDLVRYLSGREITAVSATADERPHEGIAAALLELDGGGIAVASSSDWRAGTRSDFTVLGSAGWLDVVGGTTPAQTRVEIHTDAGLETYEDDGRSPFWHEVDDFQRAVREDGRPRADGTDGLRNLELVEGVYEAVRERRAVLVGGSAVGQPALSTIEITT